MARLVALGGSFRDSRGGLDGDPSHTTFHRGTVDMMQSLRDNMKLIIWITAIVFLVGFGILQLGGVVGDSQAGGPKGVIAKINGEPVRFQDFNQLYNQMVQQLTAQRSMQEGEDSYVREQAWQQMVRAKLMEQEARRRHIQVTPEEIKTAIRMMPPDFLMRAPVFMTDGQFDYRKYLTELDNPNSQLPWAQVEAYVAANLPGQKLQDEVVSAAKVSEGDVRDRFLLQNEKLDVHFIGFAPDSFPVDTTRIGGADIETFYKAHPELFTGPAKAKVQVLLVPRTPGESDFAAVKERLQGILDQIRAEPDSFEAFARTYSEINSAQAGGNVPGEPFSEEMRPIFVKGLRDVKVGQISEILREEKSLHIFRVDKRYPDKETGREKIHYHEIALRVQPGADAIRVAREQVNAYSKEAKREGVAAVATKHGLRTYQSDFFIEGQSGNQLFDRFPDMEIWCFQAKPGEISRPIPTENGWYLYQILDHRDAGVPPLEAVEKEARALLIHSLKTAKAEEAAKQARASVLAGMSLSDAAKHYRAFASGEAKSITRNGYITGMGRDPKSVGTLFALPVKSWSPVLSSQAAVFIAYIDAHTTPSEDEFQKQAVQIRTSLINERRQVVFVEWMHDLRKRAKIVDYRENFFDV
jgi:peptidyl-prolyl cis-trans isomerase D